MSPPRHHLARLLRSGRGVGTYPPRSRVVSSSTGRAARPSSPDDPEGCPSPEQVRETSPRRIRRPRWGGNWYATAALVTGVLGAALVTIPVSLVCGVLGLLRARR